MVSALRFLPAPFARQRWRAWIETVAKATLFNVPLRSPVSDGGRGLKQEALRTFTAQFTFARQRWRAWIETSVPCCLRWCTGRSPVSDGGRGLKLVCSHPARRRRPVRPSAMAGVD